MKSKTTAHTLYVYGVSKETMKKELPSESVGWMDYEDIMSRYQQVGLKSKLKRDNKDRGKRGERERERE